LPINLRTQNALENCTHFEDVKLNFTFWGAFENQFIQKMQIPIKSKIPKIISGIATTIALISVVFFLLPSFWFWVSLEIFAAGAVAIGCSGEWWLHHHPAGREKRAKQEHHKLESRFISLVALGVIMELFALGHSIREGVKLEGKISEANNRTANTESNNLVLRSNVVALEKEMGVAETKVASLDPNNQPVISLSAYSTLLLKADEVRGIEKLREVPMQASSTRIKWPQDDGIGGEILMFGRFWDMGNVYGVWLISDNVTTALVRDGTNIFVRVDSYFTADDSKLSRFKPLRVGELTALQIIRLPGSGVVCQGEVEFVINGSIRKVFLIPKQRTFMNTDVTSVSTNNSFIPVPKDDIKSMMNPLKFEELTDF
jgi:hypothetical protein